MGSPARERPSTMVLVAADASALVVFVLAGIRSHHEVGAADLLARNLIPLGLAWSVVAIAVGTYRRPGLRTLLATWVLAVPAGVLVRSWWVGSPTGGELLQFVGVASGFTLLFLLAARWLVRLAGPRAPGPSRSVVR